MGMTLPIPIALTIAGSDPSGGAGIQADLKAFAANGAYGAAVITALTAQNTRGVTGVHVVPEGFIAAQITAVLTDCDVRAIKTGMLANAETIAVVADALADWPDIPLVLDPVMVAQSGAPLLEPFAEETMITRLIPRASLITPNLPEAARLLGEREAKDVAEMATQAEALLGLGARAVLIKGGHAAAGTVVVDLLATRDGIREIIRPRIATTNTHGTGCTLAASIAAHIAYGVALSDAVDAARDYLQGALAAADRLKVGQGAGPVHHFWRWY